jgi:hypothetical protein
MDQEIQMGLKETEMNLKENREGSNRGSRDTCYGLVHSKFPTNSNSEHRHASTNKSTCMQRLLAG